MEKKTLIQNCTVLTFDGTKPKFLSNRDILIQGSTITAVEPTSSFENVNAVIIDAAGKLAVPGMINTHAHVPMVLFRNAGPDLNANDWFNKIIFPLEANLTPEDVYWGAMLGIAEMIESGITCAADHYFYMDSVARAVEQSGMRANLVWAVFGHEGYQKLEETLVFIERWQGKGDGRITTWIGPHSPYLCDPDFLSRCASEAKSLGIGSHIHVSETAEQVTLSFDRYGKSPVRVLQDSGILDYPCIMAHCLYPSDEDLEIIADHPSGIAQAPKTYLSLAMGLADLPKYLRYGIPVGLATDGAVSSSNLDLFEQMRLTGLTQKHHHRDAEMMDLDTLLDLAFQGGARVLHQPKLGNLKPGYLADLVLLKQDRASVHPVINHAANLVYNLGAGDVDTVICNGEVIYLNGEHQTLNKAEIYAEVDQRLERLLKIDLKRKVADYPS
ncbi:MAG: amidohydrolase [Brevefilum sp.]|nr:amidohydrolase [Brevefilum sp.]MDT8381767.1 amidohydrolase [Brevefilum sp.]MDW7754884.1 amidohydrolase [Brevefilum sp.]